MPKTKAKPKTKKPRTRRTLTRTRAARRATPSTQSRRHKPAPLATKDEHDADHPYVLVNGEPAYVLVPLDEYEEFVKASMVQSAIAKLNDPNAVYVDADDFALELAAERIAKARKAKGMTQKQLAAKLKVPQSQISRIERNPDRTTVRTLKRIAKALDVDVSALI